MSEAELEVFGIDWKALRDEDVLRSKRNNNDLQEQPDTWLGREGPPPNLNEVQVNAPEAPLTPAEIQSIGIAAYPWGGLGDDDSIAQMWIHGLATAQSLRPCLF